MSQVTSEQKRQRNPRGDGARLKDELIEAAMRLLDAQPGVQLSLRAVAKEAGVAPPSVYRHFSNAEAMMLEIGLQCWSLLADEMIRAADAGGQQTPFDALKAKMSAYVYYAMERPSRYQLLFDFAGGFELVSEGPMRPAYRAVLESIETIAAQGKRLPAADPATSTLLVISIAHGRIALAHLARHRPGNYKEGVEAFVLQMLDNIFLD
jgi:AcrR family transcriptional regulator